jgi:hypothetical protein
MHQLAQQRQGALSALDKVFRQPDLPPEIEALAPRALAWVHVVLARMCFAGGYADAAALDLEQALALDPGLADERNAQLLETLLSPVVLGSQSQVDLAAIVTPHLPPALRSHPANIRRALARADMAALFRWSSQVSHPAAWPAIRRAFWDGIRQDPGWLRNRGVWSILFRAWAAHL